MEVSGDSIMGLMMLAAAKGTKIDVTVEGDEAEALAMALRTWWRSGSANRADRPPGADCLPLCPGAARSLAMADPEADPDPGQRKPYHHGNLRQALVEATLSLIEERGPLGFSLAEAARRRASARRRPTGISRAARI